MANVCRSNPVSCEVLGEDPRAATPLELRRQSVRSAWPTPSVRQSVEPFARGAGAAPVLTDAYFFVLPPVPDSIIKEADYILLLARSDSLMYRFLLNWLTDEYIYPKYMGQDAVFVHLFEKRHQLDRVHDMPFPDGRLILLAHEIDVFVPFPQEMFDFPEFL